MAQELGEVDVVVRVVTGDMDAGLARARKSAEDFSNASSTHFKKSEMAMEGARAQAELLEFAMDKLKEAMVIGGIGFGIEKIIEITSSWTDLNSRLKEVTGSAAAGQATMERLIDVANRTYTPIERTTEGFLELRESLSGLGVSAKATLDFQEALNDALVVTSTKGAAAAAVQEALTRAMAQGSLRGIQLNTVINRGSEVAKLLAHELGGEGPQALRRFAAQGRITSDVILTTLIKNLDELRKKADAMPATLFDAIFTTMGNSVTIFIGKMDEGIGTSKALAAGIVQFALAIQRATVPAINSVNLAISIFDTALTDLGLHSQTASRVLTMFFETVIGVLAIRAIVSLTRAIGVGLVGAIRLLSVAMMGNPLIAFVTALVAAGVAIYTFRDEINKAFGVDVVATLNDFVNEFIRAFMIVREAFKLFIKDLNSESSAKSLFYEAARNVVQYFVDDFIKEINNATRFLTAKGLPHGDLIDPNQFKADPLSVEADKEAQKNMDDFKKKVVEIQGTNYGAWILDVTTKTLGLADATGKSADELARIKAQTDAYLKAEEKLKFDMATAFFTPQQKAVAEVLHSVFNEDWQRHAKDTLGNLAAINFQMQQMAASADALKQMQFDSATMFMSQFEKAAADAMHSAFPEDWEKHMHDLTAETARFNEKLKETYSTTRDFVGTFVHGILDGKTAIESLNDALKNLENKIVDMALDAVVQGFFKMMMGGGNTGGTNIFAALLGMPAGATNPTVPTTAPGGLYATGGVVGSTPVRHHRRGAKLAYDEYPAILHVGERVIPRGGGEPRINLSGEQMIRMFGGTPKFDSGFNAAAASAGAYTAGDTGATGSWSSVSGGGGNATLSALAASQFTGRGGGGNISLSHGGSGGGGNVSIGGGGRRAARGGSGGGSGGGSRAVRRGGGGGGSSYLGGGFDFDTITHGGMGYNPGMTGGFDTTPLPMGGGGEYNFLINPFGPAYGIPQGGYGKYWPGEAPALHQGGYVGSTPGAMRSLPMSVFDGAPYFDWGLTYSDQGSYNNASTPTAASGASAFAGSSSGGSISLGAGSSGSSAPTAGSTWSSTFFGSSGGGTRSLGSGTTSPSISIGAGLSSGFVGSGSFSAPVTIGSAVAAFSPAASSLISAFVGSGSAAFGGGFDNDSIPLPIVRPGTPNLFVGGRNNDPVQVTQLQTFLSTHGYNVGPLDGVFGGQTRLALRQFETDQGLGGRRGVYGPRDALRIQRILEGAGGGAPPVAPPSPPFSIQIPTMPPLGSVPDTVMPLPTQRPFSIPMPDMPPLGSVPDTVMPLPTQRPPYTPFTPPTHPPSTGITPPFNIPMPDMPPLGGVPDTVMPLPPARPAPPPQYGPQQWSSAQYPLTWGRGIPTGTTPGGGGYAPPSNRVGWPGAGSIKPRLGRFEDDWGITGQVGKGLTDLARVTDFDAAILNRIGAVGSGSRGFPTPFITPSMFPPSMALPIPAGLSPEASPQNPVDTSDTAARQWVTYTWSQLPPSVRAQVGRGGEARWNNFRADFFGIPRPGGPSPDRSLGNDALRLGIRPLKDDLGRGWQSMLDPRAAGQLAFSGDLSTFPGLPSLIQSLPPVQAGAVLDPFGNTDPNKNQDSLLRGIIQYDAAGKPIAPFSMPPSMSPSRNVLMPGASPILPGGLQYAPGAFDEGPQTIDELIASPGFRARERSIMQSQIQVGRSVRPGYETTPNFRTYPMGVRIPQYYTGGVVGSTPVPHRWMSASMFKHAPRLQGGLNADEYPAILHAGETVTPAVGRQRSSPTTVVVNTPPQQPPTVTVNVINNSGAQVTANSSEDNGNVRLDIMVDQMVASKMRDGGSRIARTMSSMGARGQPLRR